MRSVSPVVERARPLLGTLVSIRAAGACADRAHAAIDAAFGEIALVHRLMSFHQADSDVGRLNRGAYAAPVAVHPHTAAVLCLARAVAEASGGAFDITVAPELAHSGLLPVPEGAATPDASADWHDIVIDGNIVCFRRALWIDLGGIAKGYAVDLAIAVLKERGLAQGCVNAGGDLRVFGSEPEWISLRTDLAGATEQPAMLLTDGSVAGSGGAAAKRRHRGRWCGPHIDARRRRSVGLSSFACVTAESCAVADALTKVVLSEGRRADRVLRRFDAAAHLYDRRWGWRSLGGAA